MTPEPSVGDRVAVRRRNAGQYEGRVASIDPERLVLEVTYGNGNVSQVPIARRQIASVAVIEPGTPADLHSTALVTGAPVLVRSYHGRTAAEASPAFAAEASALAAQGYRAVNQVWSDGGRTEAAKFWLFIGVLGIAGMLLWFPMVFGGVIGLVIGLVSPPGPGALTVTYQLEAG